MYVNPNKGSFKFMTSTFGLPIVVRQLLNVLSLTFYGFLIAAQLDDEHIGVIMMSQGICREQKALDLKIEKTTSSTYRRFESMPGCRPTCSISQFRITEDDDNFVTVGPEMLDFYLNKFLQNSLMYRYP
jgi:hypothetical protein